MIRMLLKTAINSYKRYWLNTIINICGLGIGLALSILLAIFIRHEKGIDRFNKNYERIFFLSEDDEISSTVAAIGPMIVENIPEVESFLRFENVTKCFVTYKEKSELIDLAMLSDSSLFNFFDLKLLEGDKNSALSIPLSVVLPVSTARKIFGTENAFGKSLMLNGKFELRVTGIIEDLPSDTHLKGDMFISFNSLPVLRNNPTIFNSYGMINYSTYLLLSEGAKRDVVVSKINDLAQSEGKKLNIEYLKEGKFRLTTIGELYFSQPKNFYFKSGNLSFIRIFSALAIAILLIAVINYINLSTSQAFVRSHILAIKKTMGAGRSLLFWQIMTEAILISFVAINLALVLIELIKPVFNTIMNMDIRVGYFENPLIILLLIAGGLLTGVISGIYPALYITKFNTIQTLSKEIVTGRKGIIVRSSLTIIQFAVASILIIGTLTIKRQMKYVKNRDLGFNKEQLLFFNITRDQSGKKDVLKQELLKIPSVKSVSFSYSSYRTSFERWGFTYKGQDMLMHIEIADPAYIKTLGIQLIEGRDFFEGESDKGNFIINEAANRKYFNGQGLGTKLGITGSDNLIIGIAKDYNFQSLHSSVEPLGILYDNFYNLANIRIEGNNIEQTLTQIRKASNVVLPGYPIDIIFVDQYFNALYFKEQQLGRIFIFFALATIFIACMGVLGLVSFSFQRRKREVCLRKVHGATVSELIRLLTFDLSRYILIANIIAVPIAWIIMKRWLAGFAYNAGISYFHFILAILITWLVAQLAVLYQTLKTARVNPAEVIKAE